MDPLQELQAAIMRFAERAQRESLEVAERARQQSRGDMRQLVEAYRLIGRAEALRDAIGMLAAEMQASNAQLRFRNPS